ncbi:hypothetical protein MSG_04944 [Mycobacterium shigaense]|uniref:Uncharacterized protein n=1 Tax=Mycobacterium shigaense TaxID=722731 RepID=A0A1Z4EQ48_9MYCO|nr:hypothetical protein MSG_04944 [Mycobacterium shigaense]
MRNRTRRTLVIGDRPCRRTMFRCNGSGGRRGRWRACDVRRRARTARRRGTLTCPSRTLVGGRGVDRGSESRSGVRDLGSGCWPVMRIDRRGRGRRVAIGLGWAARWHGLGARVEARIDVKARFHGLIGDFVRFRGHKELAVVDRHRGARGFGWLWRGVFPVDRHRRWRRTIGLRWGCRHRRRGWRCEIEAGIDIEAQFGGRVIAWPPRGRPEQPVVVGRHDNLSKIIPMAKYGKRRVLPSG